MADSLVTLERRYQDLVQGLDAIVWEADAQTHEFTFVSARAEAVLGYPVERWLSEPGFFREMADPDERERVKAHRTQAARVGRHEARFQLVAADGRRLWFHEVVRALPSGQESPDCLRGVMVDVSGREETHRFIRVQAQLLDEVEAAVIATDPRGVVTFWNRHSEELFGWRREEAVGLSVAELHVSAEGLAQAEAIRRRLLAGKPYRGELVYRRKDGGLVSTFCRASAIRDEEGRIAGLIAISDDLTDRKRVDEQIRFQARLLDSLDAAVVATDLDMVVKHWSTKAEELYGWTAEEALGRNSLELLTPPENRDEAEMLVPQMRAGQGWEREYEALRKDGSRVQVWAKCASVYDEQGAPVGRVALVVDVSEQHRIASATEAREAEKSAILRASLDGIVTIDERGNVTDFNPAAERLFGYSRDDAVGRELADLVVPPHLRERHRAGLRRVVATGESGVLDQRLEATALRADGSEFPVELVITRMEGEGPARFAGFVRDISERREAERNIAQLSERDPLTGVASMRLLRRRLAEVLSRADREASAVALLCVDLRRFSLVNDSLGRTRGDELLRGVATRLVELKPAPQVVAREGGDEFWLVCSLVASSRKDRWREAASQEAERIGQAVQDTLAEPFSVGGAEVSLQAGIGMSIYPLDALNPDTMVEHAEVATREAQRILGRPAVPFSGHAGDPRAELALMSRLSGALGREEFTLHYQPVVELARWGEGDRRAAVVGVEALLRWRDPVQGLVLPGGFLGLLEETGLITGVGNWVADELARQIAAWREAGLELQGAFNLSARELWQPDLDERLASAIAAHGLEPGAVMVEITESAAMTDPEAATRVLAKLRERGFELAIDDFGVGHSSLARLRDLPADVVKIDRSFTKQVPGDRPTEVIVDAILAAAPGLGLRTLAEGIETQEQLEFMLERGCELGQGYLFGRPVPADELELS